MKRIILFAAIGAALLTSCKMENPLLSESPLEYGAPQFDKIKNEHYLPAFKQAIAEAAAKQSKRSIIPVVSKPMTMKPLIKDLIALLNVIKLS